ncbi:MAG TPA: hypothetical protein VFW70_24520 [Methylomirabilota bacterium]|nr:hypothetical protein [Methylomirabilota bacterium]
MRYTDFMRAVRVFTVLAGLTLAARPLPAAPPEDLPTYCRSTYPNVQAQVRCLYTEKAAQDRAARTRAAVAPEAWSGCEGSSASWTAMDSCLSNVAAIAPSSAGGSAALRGGGEAPRADQGATAAAPGGSGGVPDGDAAVSPETATPPSTVILGPQDGPAATAAEPSRPTPPVTEAEAERHLKAVLERSGEPRGRCTKKQYGGGWVTVCE